DSGDIGSLTDENMLVISGRKKEIFNLGGDKISPRTIEDTLTGFYGIRDAAAFTMPNELGVDEVWALIVPIGKLNEEALQKHCRGTLAQTQVPSRFISVSEFPRNPNGKVDRAQLSATGPGLAGSGGGLLAYTASPLSLVRLKTPSALKNGISAMTCVALVHTVEAACGGC